jgi:transcription antitermination factor NusG
MILQYGNVGKLKNSNWYFMELSSDKTIQSIMRRVGKQIPQIFRDNPVEIFLPVHKRDLDVFEMKTGSYVFVRSTPEGFHSLLRLKTVTGVLGLVTEGESNQPSKSIPVENSYVQGLIKDAEKAFNDKASDIQVGLFVRIIDGETRDYCGIVETINDGKAVVKVDLKTKCVLVETPVRNLINLDHVPKELRVFYYNPVLSELAIDSREIEELVAEDRAFIEKEDEFKDNNQALVKQRHSRQKTVTALVKRLILIDKQIEPIPIAKLVIKAIKNEDVKAPKNLFIVYCIIKNSLMEHYFRKKDNAIRNYREVIHKYGRQYKFSADDIAVLDSELRIPVSTTDVCKDGRSREARMKKKQG